MSEVAPLVGRLRIDRRQDDLRCDACEEQRVAVRRRGVHRLRANGAGGAGLVLHHDRLPAEIARRVLREVARRKVGVAPRGERNDELNWTRRVLCLHRRTAEEQGDGERARHAA